MRIKDIPNFYEKLHAMEKETVVGQKQQVHFLWHIKEDDPHLLELQKMLNVGKKAKSPLLSPSEINLTVLMEAVKQSVNSGTQIAELAGMKYGTFSNKLYRTNQFTVAELGTLEKVLGLEAGVLIK